MMIKLGRRLKELKRESQYNYLWSQKNFLSVRKSCRKVIYSTSDNVSFREKYMYFTNFPPDVLFGY